MTPTTADTIVDLTVAELTTVIPDTFEFSEDCEISARDLPNFELIQATETTQIQVAAVPNVELARASRVKVNQTIKIGIGVVRKLDRDPRGELNATQFRELKSLMQAIYQWAHAGVAGYQGQVRQVSLPAWYDFEKAVSGTFLSVISVSYDTRFAP